MPSIIASSPLKELNAENCSIKTVHESLFRPGINVNLQNNKILTLPKGRMLEFFQAGGQIGDSELDVRRNPLQYPPMRKFEEGRDAVIEYLKSYDNNMINAQDIAVILMGQQNAGKTSLGHCLSGRISEAADIKEEDRTQALDVYHASVKNMEMKLVDLGGHREYEASLPLMSRDKGLHMSLLNPSDLVSEEAMYKAVGYWIDKALDGAISPNILFVVSKMDTIQKQEKAKMKQSMREKLQKYLQTKLSELQAIRTMRVQDLRSRLDETRMRKKEGRSGVDLEAEEHTLQEQLDEAIFRLNNLPNFFVDRICFVSSTKSREGYTELEDNLAYCISTMEDIKIQPHWQEKMDWLFSNYADEPYILFWQLLKDSGMKEADLIEMLLALHWMGRINWSKEPDRRDLVFLNLESLAIIMKSVFYHGMADTILPRFAQLKGVDENILKEKYGQGQLPLDLTDALFIHNSNRYPALSKNIKIDYSNLKLPIDAKSDKLIIPFRAMLKQTNLVIPLNETVEGLEMGFIPQLVFQLPHLSQNEWIKDHIHSNPVFELGLMIKFETALGKNTIAKSCAIAMQFMGILAEMPEMGEIAEGLSYDAIESAIVIRVGHFEIIIQHNFQENGLCLAVRLTNGEIRNESVWILLHELATKLGFVNNNTIFVCPFVEGRGRCNHMPYYHGTNLRTLLSLEEKAIVKYKQEIQCPQKETLPNHAFFPTKFIKDVLRCLHPVSSEKASCSPFMTPLPPIADYLEVLNFISVFLTKPISDLSKIAMLHPVFKSGFEKCYLSIQPIRQWFDNLMASYENCVCKDCPCKTQPNLTKPNCDCKACEDCKHAALSKFVRAFECLEENRLVVTKGEWKEAMRKIMEDHPNCTQKVEGLDSSIFELVRVFRNEMGHVDPSEYEYALFQQVRATFGWLVMHCFQHRIRFILPDPDPTITLFAESFYKLEKAECDNLHTGKKAVIKPQLKEPIIPLFKVVVAFKDALEKEIILFHESQKAVMDLQNEVNKTLSQINKSLSLPRNIRVLSMGTHPSSAIREVQPSDTLAILGLDTNQTHLIRMEELSKIDVQVTLKTKDKPAKVLMFKVDVDQSFDELLTTVERQEGEASGEELMDSLCFCHMTEATGGKPKEVDGKKLIASTCITFCELVALDKKSVDYEKKTVMATTTTTEGKESKKGKRGE